MNRSRNYKITASLLLAALTLGSLTLPVRADQANTTGKKATLPSCGVSYALSANKVSFKDVEKQLVGEGKMEKKQPTASSKSSLTEKIANAVTGPKTPAQEDQTQEAEEESAFVETRLTPVQAREKELVETVSEQTGMSLDNAAATTISAAAVNVVVGGASNEEIIQSQVAKNEAAVRDAQIELGIIPASAAGSGTGEGASDGQTGDGSMNEETEMTSEDAAEALESADVGSMVVSVADSYVNVRKEPSADAEIIGKLYGNAVGDVLEDDGEWVKIHSGDVTGYVKKEYVASGAQAQELASELATQKATITTTTLRVRAAASTDSDVITLIGGGAEIEILSEEGNFYKVSTPDGEGYISKDFADVEQVYPQAISNEEESSLSKAQLEAAEYQRQAAEARKQAEQAKKEAQAAKTEAERQVAEAAAQAAREKADLAAKVAAQAKIDADKADAEAAAAAAKSSASGSSSGSAVQQTSSRGQQVVNYALQFIGNPYVWGGSSLTNGADCSGFTMAVYSRFGVSLPHYDASQRSCGTAVASLAEARPGDLICYNGHVGIYMGNNQIVHASNPRTGITTGRADYRTIVAIRRIFN